MSPTFMICVHDKVRGLCRKHLDMSRWFVSATFMICIQCSRLFPWKSFGECRRNGIWAYACHAKPLCGDGCLGCRSTGLTPGWVAIEWLLSGWVCQPSRSTQFFIPVDRLVEYQPERPVWLGFRWGACTNVRWQVRLCDFAPQCLIPCLCLSRLYQGWGPRRLASISGTA